jgi:large subunit ribosomal protein L24
VAAKLAYRGSEPTKFKTVKLHKDDEVIVIAGKDKGRKGKVLALDKKRDRVFIEGVNKRKRFVRPTQENPQGGQIEIEFPIHISNVMYYDAKKKKGTRIGYSEIKGKKVRVTKPEGREI